MRKRSSLLRYYNLSGQGGNSSDRQKPFNTKSVNRPEKRTALPRFLFNRHRTLLAQVTAPTPTLARTKQSSDPPASLTVPRRPSAQLAPNAVRSWSCHTRVNAQHGTALHPSGSPQATSANSRRTHATTATFPSLLVALSTLVGPHTRMILATVLPHTLTSLTPEHAPMSFLFPVQFVISSFHPPSLGSASG